MKATCLTAALIGCALFFAQPASAEIIGTEQFDYPDGPIAGQNGGIYWDYENIAPAGHTSSPSNWDNITSAPAISAGRLVTSNSSAKREYNGPNVVGETNGAVNAINDAKKVFYRVTVTTGATLPTSFGLSSYDFGAERIFFGKRSGATQFGVEEVGGGSTNGSFTISANTTYTLVAMLDFAGDVIRLYVNPDLNGPEPGAGSAAAALPYTGTNWSTAVRLACGTGGSVTWDNLVVATNWDDLGTVVTTTADQDDVDLSGLVSLREAVKHSISGTLITFDPGLSGQTITLDPAKGMMKIEKTILIEGTSYPGGYVTVDAGNLPSGITVNANFASRIFQVQSANSFTLLGMTLSRGRTDGPLAADRSGGAIHVLSGASLLVKQCTFSGNEATAGGGAIYHNSSGLLTVRDCTFIDNRATDNGGAVLNGSSVAVLSNSTFTGNTAGAGGGIYNDNVATLTNCTLSGNAASSQGGAVVNAGGMSVQHTIMSGNAAPSGPDLQMNGTTITATGVNLIGNLANSGLTAGSSVLVGDAKLSALGSYGGPVQTMHPLIGSPAIDAAGATAPSGTDARGFPRLVDGDASGSAQLDIGAVEAGPLRIVDAVGELSLTGLQALIYASVEPGARIGFSSSLFPATTVPSFSGLIIPSDAKSLFIDASNLPSAVTISGNNSSRVFTIAQGASVMLHSLKIVNGTGGGSFGGGISNDGTCTLIACTLSGNAVPGNIGGGIYNSGTCTVLSSTFSGNVASSGGGIYNAGTCTVRSATFSGNSAVSAEGGAIFNLGSCRVVSSTLSGNSAPPNSGGGISNFGSATFHLTTSIVAGNTPSDSNILGTLTTSLNSITSGDPLLGPLASNGGPTQTMRPLPGSPARDIGGSANEVQEIPAPDTDIVNHSLTFQGQTTWRFPMNVSAADMQLALTSLSTIGPGNVSVAASGLTRIVTFTGALGNADQPKITSSLPINNNILVLTEGRTGNPEPTDQRGFARFGTPDIGAYEAQIGTINNVTIKANTSSSSLPFTVGQVGTLTATSGNTTLIPNSGIVLGGSGANRTITLTPAARQIGSALITITDSLSGETTSFTLTVTGFIVTVTGDSGANTLRQAFANAAAAPGPDLIVLAPNLGTITLANEIVITDSDGVTLDASDRPTGLAIDAGPGTNRHFRIDPNAVVTLQRLHLYGGGGTGGGSPVNYGGSIHNQGSLTLRECTLANNTSANIAGAVYNQAGTLNVERCTFHNNTAGGVGALLHESLTPMNVSHSTFTGNVASFEGGAITVGNFRPAVITHCTISGNQVTQTGGGGGGGIRTIAGEGNLLTLSYSIVTGNTDANSPGVANASPGPGSTANMLSGNALLAPLGDYGGPTPTMALRPGSLARDIATSSTATTDQRGFGLVGVKDLGAYEAGNQLLTSYNMWIWETLPNTATAPQAATTFDFDGDGTSNQLEWLTQTDAANPSSAFRPAVSVSGFIFNVTFPTVQGRTYQLQASPNLANPWSSLGSGGAAAGTGGNVTLGVDMTGFERYFFRVNVSAP